MAVAEKAPARTEGAETARRALRVVEAVVAADAPLALADLAGAVELSKSTCYRLARVLQDERYLDRAGSGGYRAGPRLVGLAASVLSDVDVYAAARPALQVLAAVTGETVTLHVRSGDRAVLVLGVESSEQLRRAATVGESTWLGRGCSGRAILAALDRAEAEPITRTAEDPESLRTELAALREAGYTLSFGDNHPGVHGIAAPVPNRQLSVAVSGPATRCTEHHLRTFAEPLLATCTQLAGGPT
ncbi:IclR family transcriptional regulator [Pseudonocardia spinosispora]|uniref:IclR family transcriptional regulator n=1 Tax=Pseudonocardia spinosispora TaxID=103441 RepID=UPI0004283914|nr:IclR family transcriptional regulator C-terminal domain-containing protein [Pseudonocardia spinosispora]